jgi:hypothetical protein
VYWSSTCPEPTSTDVSKNSLRKIDSKQEEHHIQEVTMTTGNRTWLRHGIIFLVGAVCLLGWFGVQAVQAQDHGKLLLDQGFQQWNVDSPKEKAFFDKHPSDQFTTYKRGDKTVHVFKDPQSGMVYVGDDAAHQQYLQTVKAQNLTPKSRQDAAEQSDPDFWLNWEDEYGP